MLSVTLVKKVFKILMFKIFTFRLKLQPSLGESDKKITKITSHITKSVHFSKSSFSNCSIFGWVGVGVGGCWWDKTKSPETCLQTFQTFRPFFEIYSLHQGNTESRKSSGHIKMKFSTWYLGFPWYQRKVLFSTNS